MNHVTRATVRKRVSLVVLLMLTVTIAISQHVVLAKDDKSDCRRSQDCALNAFKNGEIRPLTEVLAVAHEKLPGEVVKIELEREDGVWVYEIKVLTPSGKRREIEINAQTLAVIKID